MSVYKIVINWEGYTLVVKNITSITNITTASAYWVCMSRNSCIKLWLFFFASPVRYLVKSYVRCLNIFKSRSRVFRCFFLFRVDPVGNFWLNCCPLRFELCIFSIFHICLNYQHSRVTRCQSTGLFHACLLFGFTWFGLRLL